MDGPRYHSLRVGLLLQFARVVMITRSTWAPVGHKNNGSIFYPRTLKAFWVLKFVTGVYSLIKLI